MLGAELNHLVFRDPSACHDERLRDLAGASLGHRVSGERLFRIQLGNKTPAVRGFRRLTAEEGVLARTLLKAERNDPHVA